MARQVICFIIPIRYKQEILKLRKLVNTGDHQGMAMPSTRRPRTQSN